MIREEYLNLDFMYKFINTLCKRDSYVLTDFTKEENFIIILLK